MNLNEKKIRVLIADDSSYMRRVLAGIIERDPLLEVVGEARDGREAVDLAESLHPDVITMDLNMPRVDGLQATEMIMSQHPRPIVILSSDSRDGAETTLRALELGAIDFVPKPSSGIDLDMNQVGEELTRKIRMASKVRVVRTATRTKAGTPPAAAALAAGQAPAAWKSATPASEDRFPIVVIAASTGGPAMVMRLAPRFPKNYPAAIFLVQHMPATFTSQFGLQLAEVSQLRVKEAEHCERFRPGTFYVCPGSHHLSFSATGKILLDSGPRILGYRPSADVALETAASFAGKMALAVILTGMGNDGAQGARAVKAAGGTVIAQDEATSVIFGMPAEAIKAGAVDRVLAIDDIYPAVDRCVTQLMASAVVTFR
jgi:two-component system, chemotaxis family, protein-glutamate methylesterase/glutaminase